MNIRRILSVFLVFVSICTSIRAQDTLMVFTTSITAKITYDPNESARNSVNNIIIREIAKDVIKNLKNIKLVVRANMKSCLIWRSGMTYLKISLDSFDLSGDHCYRKFSFSDVMIPSWISFTIQFRSVQDSLIVKEFEHQTFSIKKNDSTFLPIRREEFAENPCWLSIDKIDFYYDEADLSAFSQRQRLINDYYASAAIADSLELVMKSMDLKSIDLYPEYLIRIEEISKIEQLIGTRNFEQELSLHLFDPRNLIRKYNDLLRFSRSSAMTFESALDTIPVINPRLSNDSLNFEFLSVIQRYMRWSFLINERNSNLYREFLDRFYSMKVFDDDERVFKKLIGKVYPGSDADSVFKEILMKLKLAYQQKAEAFSAGSQFAEAVDMLDHLKRLEDRYWFLKDTLSEQNARMKAAYGIYASYIGVAENSIRLGKNKIAKWYLEKAVGYAQSNPSLILSDTLYRKALFAYHLSSLMGCDDMNLKGDFTGAVNCYNDFLKSLDSVSGSILAAEIDQRISSARKGMISDLVDDLKQLIKLDKHDSALLLYDQILIAKERIAGITSSFATLDSLQPVIERYRYNYLVAGAERFGNQRHFTNANNALIQAGKIAKEQQYTDDPLRDSLNRRIYPKYIEEQFARARPLIWTNQFSQALSYADSIENILVGNGFINDPEIRSTMLSYRTKIDERICWVVSENMDVLMIRVQRNIISRNFLSALSLLDSALLITRTYPDCHLDSPKINDTIIKYLPAKQYQEMMIKLDGYVSLELFSGFVNQYLEAGKFHERNTLQQFGLVYLPLFDYVTNKSKDQLTLSVINYYMYNKVIAEAFRYLKLLKKQTYPPDTAKELLKSMGQKMAAKDHQSEPMKDPSVFIEQYTNGDKWFANFAVSYMKEWKRLTSKVKMIDDR
jgi:hypothetical protein